MLVSYPFRFAVNNIMRSFNRPSSPFLLNYSITFRCMLDCKYCGAARLTNNYAAEELTFKDISEFLKDRMLKKLRVIVISGGEPFLKNDFDEILLEFQKKVSPRVFHITTNGFLADKIVESVKSLKRRGLNIEMKISIDDISDKHDLLRNGAGSFNKAVETIQRLRGIFDAKQLPIGINQTIFEDNHKSIPEVRRLARSLGAAYRGFIGLQKRPLYNRGIHGGYGLVKLSNEARECIKDKLRSIYGWKSYFSNKESIVEEVIIKHYIKKQIKMLEDAQLPPHKCMCLFTHFRLNPNGDIITCSYDLDVLGNIRKEGYSSIMNKEETKNKLRQVKVCGRCWLGCEVSPSWVSSLFSR